jgi:hypothetical protein
MDITDKKWAIIALHNIYRLPSISSGSHQAHLLAWSFATTLWVVKQKLPSNA